MNLPAEWMRRVCGRSVPAVLDLYVANAVLVPTLDKSMLPGAGLGVLVGRDNIAGYFRRFLAKRDLCGQIDTVIEQQLGGVTVYSGLYTFRWRELWSQSVVARYTFVTAASKIVTHHSSAQPAR